MGVRRSRHDHSTRTMVGTPTRGVESPSSISGGRVEVRGIGTVVSTSAEGTGRRPRDPNDLGLSPGSPTQKRNTPNRTSSATPLYLSSVGRSGCPPFVRENGSSVR